MCVRPTPELSSKIAWSRFKGMTHRGEGWEGSRGERSGGERREAKWESSRGEGRGVEKRGEQASNLAEDTRGRQSAGEQCGREQFGSESEDRAVKKRRRGSEEREMEQSGRR